MHILHSIAELRAWRQGLPCGQSVGFAPTMGALHAGHASLVRRAAHENTHALASIFVNPTQFGPHEDLGKYPRTFEADCELLAHSGAAAVFAPQAAEIYPGTAFFHTRILQLADGLCGRSRPTHFDGVVQVVNILFNLAQPARAYFGEKDFQQLAIIRRMAAEFHHPVEVLGCPTVREADGLAMSSRNRYLAPEARAQAVALWQVLSHLRAHCAMFEAAADMASYAEAALRQFPLVALDYIEVLEADTLTPVGRLADAQKPHAFIAAWISTARLIDNLALY